MEQAMQAAGVTLAQVAKAGMVSERVAQHCVRWGCDCYWTAAEMARTIGCDPKLFNKHSVAKRYAEVMQTNRPRSLAGERPTRFLDYQR
jgi:hypothetical protein